MGILGRKKKQDPPTEDDFKSLDASVSALSEQTSALLTHFGEKNGDGEPAKDSKPTMPKRVSAAKAPGKSFDIIQGPRSASTNKTITPAVTKQQQADEEPELLPEHAGKSFNELDDGDIQGSKTEKSESDVHEASSPKKDSPEPAADPSAPTIVTSHPAGSLSFVSSNTQSVVAEEVDGQETENTDAAKQEHQEEPATSVVDSQKTIQFDDSEKEEEPEKLEKSDATVKDLITDTDGQSKEDTATSDDHKSQTGDKAAEAPATGEVFANNLVKDGSPKGYEPAEGQQKPTVFDTNEYHPELHDWSKLDHGHGGKWYVLALLVTIAGALAYFIFSGQKLPFMP